MSKKIYKALFFGTPEFSVPVLKKMTALPFLKIAGIFTQPDKPVGRKQAITPPAVKLFAQKNNLEVFQPNKIKAEKIEQTLRQLAPDVIIIIAYGKIIPKNLLNIPAFGWLNIHASLLPKFRGASPIQQAILDGEKQSGTTLMQLDEGLDTGPVISQKTINIDSAETSQTLHDKLGRLSAELIEKDLLNYLQGKITPRPQDSSQASETKIISKQDGRIDWRQPADYIERQLRAYTPWPGIYCFWSPAPNKPEQRLKILSVAVLDTDTKLPPGQTKGINDKILVGTGQGVLEITKIQLEGKKIQLIADFLKGYPNFCQTQLN